MGEASHFDISWYKVQLADVLVCFGVKMGWQHGQRNTTLGSLGEMKNKSLSRFTRKKIGVLHCLKMKGSFIQWIIRDLTVWTWMLIKKVKNYFLLKIDKSANK